MKSNRKALLIRMGPYDMTQAIPRAATTLQEMGFSNVKSMAGGFAAWKAEGREIAGESW